LPYESRFGFFLYAVGFDLNLELKNDDIITEIIDNWGTLETQYIKKEQHPCRIMFRPVASLSLAAERKIKDNMSIHTFYSQAITNFDKGYYNMEYEEVVSLVGLRCQVHFGDYNQEEHGNNYLTNILNIFIPNYIIKKKRNG